MIGHVLLLAAGHSTRIAAVSGGLPKPLLKIEGKPVLVHHLEWLTAHGVRSAWVNLHYQPDVIRSALGNGERFGLSLSYSWEPSILGTAGAWKKLEAEWVETSLVIYADSLMRFDLSRFRDVHRASGALATVALFDRASHPNTGIAGGHVEIAEDGRITRFVEGGVASGNGPRYVNVGAYLLEPEMRERIGSGFQDFGRDVFPQLAAQGCLEGHVLEDGGFCLGLDTPQSFQTARELISSARVTLR